MNKQKTTGIIVALFVLVLTVSCDRKAGVQASLTPELFPGIGFRSLPEQEPFEAVVLAAKAFPVPGESRTVAIVELRKSDGSRFGLSERDATEQELKFVDFLEVNRTYRFPDVWNDFIKARSAEKE